MFAGGLHRKCLIHYYLLIFQVIAAIGGFAYIMDKDGNFRNSFDDGWDRILSRHPIPFYYCIGKLTCVHWSCLF